MYTWLEWSARDKTASSTERYRNLAPNQFHPLITQLLPGK